METYQATLLAAGITIIVTITLAALTRRNQLKDRKEDKSLSEQTKLTKQQEDFKAARLKELEISLEFLRTFKHNFNIASVESINSAADPRQALVTHITPFKQKLATLLNNVSLNTPNLKSDVDNLISSVTNFEVTMNSYMSYKESGNTQAFTSALGKVNTELANAADRAHRLTIDLETEWKKVNNQ